MRTTRVRFRTGYQWQLRRFLGSRGHVVGMLFAIVGLILLNNGVMSGYLGLAMVILLYATGYFFAERPQIERLPVTQTRDAPAIQAALDEMLSAIRVRVSNDIYFRVRSIRDAILFILDTAGEQSEADPDIHMVRQTATTYLPDVLSTYLALPRLYAERDVVDGSRTSHDILLDQLYLMDLKVRQVAENMVKNGSQRLVTPGRFLADRYSTSNLELRRPAPPDPPPPVH